MIGKTIHIPSLVGEPVVIWDAFQNMVGRVQKSGPVGFLQKTWQFLSALTEPAGRGHMLSEPTRPSPHNSSDLSVLSANLWHDFPKKRNIPQRMENFARMVEEIQPDVLLLQEITRTPEFKTDEWLADRLGMAYVYSRVNGHDRIGFEEGIGIYSTYPLGVPFLKRFRSGLHPFLRRCALGATVKSPWGDFLAFSVHLSVTPLWNRLQLRQLLDWVGKIAAGSTSIVGGDFNAWERTSGIRRVCSRWIDTFRQVDQQDPGITHEMRLPWGKLWRKRLDYVFLCPARPGSELAWKVVETRHIDNPIGRHSDHLSVLTRLSPH